MRLIKEYIDYKKKINEDYYKLANEAREIIDRLSPVIKILNMISEVEDKEINDEMIALFDYGFSFLRKQFNIIININNKYFDDNIHEFSKYVYLINMYLEIEDLKDFLENEIGENNQKKYRRLKTINEEIEKILIEKKASFKYPLSIWTNEIKALALDDANTIIFFDRLVIETLSGINND
jgi:hypothetical protein